MKNILILLLINHHGLTLHDFAMQRFRRQLLLHIFLMVCGFLAGCISYTSHGGLRDNGRSSEWWLTSAKQGIRYVEAGQYRAGLEYFNKALKEVRADKDQTNEVVVLNSIADVYARLGQYKQQLIYLEDALALTRKIGAIKNEGVILTNMGGAYFTLGDNESAAKSFAAALPLLKKSGELLHVADAFFSNSANILAAEGMYDEALELYDKALDAPLLKPANRVGILFAKGNVHFLKAEYDAALKLYYDALALAQELPYPIIQAGPLAGIGKVYEIQGRLVEALNFYERSIAAIEIVQKFAGPIHFRISLAELPASVYQQAVPLLLKTGQLSKAFELSEHIRARSILDQVAANRLADKSLLKMQRVESLRWKLLELKRELNSQRPGSERVREQVTKLENSLRKALDELKGGPLLVSNVSSAGTASLREISNSLDANTSLLVYFVARETTLIFVVTRDAVQTAKIPIGEKKLKAAVQNLDRMTGSGARGVVEAGDGLSLPLETGLRELRDWLVAPVIKFLRTDNIVIVPHGVLNYLSFASFKDDNGYLGDRYRLYALPSASMLVHLKSTSRIGRRALVMAQQKAEGFSKLAYAAEEARAIAQLYNTQSLSGEEATETNFHLQAGDADIIHLAAHGEINPVQPMFSRIILGKDSHNDGSLEVHEIYGLDLKETDLVVLSACDTQLGPLSRGDDYIGLSRAFLSAGAPAVLATLWPVDDKATGFLMTQFYASLSNGSNAADALAAAQAATRYRYPHPYYWAGFILTGNPTR